MHITRKEFWRKSGIYCFTNKINNKKYIGRAICLYTRYRKHKMGYSDAPKFEGAIQKYGFDNFEFLILEYVPEEQLNEREEYWILYYKTLEDEFGYNLIQRYEKGSRKPHTEETKQKMRDAFVKNHPNGVSGKNNPFYGKKHSEETKKNIRESSTGRFKTDETKKKISESLKKRYKSGYKMSKETYKKIAQKVALKCKGRPSEKRQKIKIFNETESIIFSSQIEAIRKMHGTFNKVRDAIKNKTIYKGFFWEKVI